MDREASCECGRLRGRLSHTEQCTRIMCYCLDCQAYAIFLQRTDWVLDGQGGSNVLVAPSHLLSLTCGLGALKCMSLSGVGMLRWYAGCCNTPIGNTARTPEGVFVGLSHCFLAGSVAEMQAAYGPVRMVSCTNSAKSKVTSTGWRAVRPMVGFVATMLAARLTRSYRNTPFFTVDAQPVVAPITLSAAERAALDRPMQS